MIPRQQLESEMKPVSVDGWGIGDAVLMQGPVIHCAPPTESRFPRFVLFGVYEPPAHRRQVSKYDNEQQWAPWSSAAQIGWRIFLHVCHQYSDHHPIEFMDFAKTEEFREWFKRFAELPFEHPEAVELRIKMEKYLIDLPR